jgi:hypothetical protein
MEPPSGGHPHWSSSGRYRRMPPMFFNRGSIRKLSSPVKANPTTLAPCLST